MPGIDGGGATWPSPLRSAACCAESASHRPNEPMITTTRPRKSGEELEDGVAVGARSRGGIGGHRSSPVCRWNFHQRLSEKFGARASRRTRGFRLRACTDGPPATRLEKIQSTMGTRDRALEAALRTAPDGLDAEELADASASMPNTVRWHLGALAHADAVVVDAAAACRARATAHRLPSDRRRRSRDARRVPPARHGAQRDAGGAAGRRRRVRGRRARVGPLPRAAPAAARPAERRRRRARR